MAKLQAKAFSAKFIPVSNQKITGNLPKQTKGSRNNEAYGKKMKFIMDAF